MKRKLSNDEIIARGDIWRGVILDLRERMGEYTVDGVRFGTLLPDTVSGSPHDRRLGKTSEEVVTAAFILGRLGYERVALVTKDINGRKLERPDLDAHSADGSVIGLEVAQVGTTRRMQHDSNIAALEHTIRDLIDTDASFAQAFGAYYLTVSTSGPLGERDVSSKKQAKAIITEVEEFVRAGGHHSVLDDSPDNGYFSPAYPALHNKGATFYSSPADYGPYFSVMDGGTVNPEPEIEEVIRVLNTHRKSALTYRTSRTWMLMYLPDSNEIFRGTVKTLATLKPLIAPFEKLHVTDTCWNVATLER